MSTNNNIIYSIYLLVFVICLVLILLLSLGQGKWKWELIENALLNPSTPDKRYHELLRYVSKITDDSLLDKQVASLQVYQNNGLFPYPDCVRGGAVLVFGTNRTYPEVVWSYAEALEKKGWIYFQGERTPSILKDNYHSKTMHVLITEEGRQKNEYLEWKIYRTIYSLNFIFAEPAIENCYG